MTKRDFPHPKFESIEIDTLIDDQNLDFTPKLNFYIINEET